MNDPQITNKVLMVSPDSFGFNPETAATNVFQKKTDSDAEEIRKRALSEFGSMATILRDAGITVFILPSRPDVVTPDAVFPNNWFSHHIDGRLVFYPMFAANRRLERQPGRLQALLQGEGVNVGEVIDMTEDENEGRYLEGTGSLVLDRENRIAYAAISPRTDVTELGKWAGFMGYSTVTFGSTDRDGVPVYHTNYMMSLGTDYAVVCIESVKSAEERMNLIRSLNRTKKKIIPVASKQMGSSCANIIQLMDGKGNAKIVLSKKAYAAFTSGQRNSLEQHGQLVYADISTIEETGGGSARCMLAEIF